VAVHAWPLAGVQFSAADMRLWLAGFLEQDGVSDTLGPIRPRGGVRRSPYPIGGNGSPLLVAAQATPNMTVAVNPGTVYIPATGGLGVYEWTLDAVTNVTIQPAHATLNRIDLVVARIVDNGDATSTADVVAIQGTAAATPSAPALPANSFALAQVTVGAAVTSVTNANIADSRAYTAALGGTSYSAAPPGAVMAVDSTGGFYTIATIAWTSTFGGGGSVVSQAFTAAPSGKAKVTVSALMFNDRVHLTGGSTFYITKLNAVVTGPSGFNRAPVDVESAKSVFTSAAYGQSTASFIVSGMTPGGIYTATLQGSIGDGTGSYLDRKLIVEPVT
jgi:hypothetical protein